MNSRTTIIEPLAFFLGISESSLGGLLLLVTSSLCETVEDASRDSSLDVMCFFESLAVDWLFLLVTGDLI